MGCLEEAEMCQLAGLYILSLLQKTVNKKDNGLYRDGGLVVLRKGNGSTTFVERILYPSSKNWLNIDI